MLHRGNPALFTVPENIRMAQYEHEIYCRFETLMAVGGDPAPIDSTGWAISGSAPANWEVDYPCFEEAIWPGLADRAGLRSAEDDQHLGRALRPEQLRRQRHPAALYRYQSLDLSRLGCRRILDGAPLHDAAPKA